MVALVRFGPAKSPSLSAPARAEDYSPPCERTTITLTEIGAGARDKGFHSCKRAEPTGAAGPPWNNERGYAFRRRSIREATMPKQLDTFPADLSIDQIRDIAHRAAKEQMEALAKAHEIIANSGEAMKRADDILVKMQTRHEAASPAR